MSLNFIKFISIWSMSPKLGMLIKNMYTYIWASFMPHSPCSDSYLLLNSYISNTRIHRVDAFLLTQIAHLRLHSYYGSIAFVTCIKISTFMHLLLQQFTNIRLPWSAQDIHKDTNSGTENGTEHTCLSIMNISTYLCFTI